MGCILSVDYGKKRIGLAVSDPGRIFAFPSGVIKNENINQVISELKKIILDKEIDLILIGMPYDMHYNKNSDQPLGDMAQEVEKFINKLKSEIQVKIETIDERLSSFVAEENLKERGISLKGSKELIDQEAARLMLEEYITNHQL